MQAPPGLIIRREISHNSKRYLFEIEDVNTKENGVLKLYTQSEVIRCGLTKFRRKYDIFQKLMILGAEGVLKATELFTIYNDTVSVLFYKPEKDKDNKQVIIHSYFFISFIDPARIFLLLTIYIYIFHF